MIQSSERAPQAKGRQLVEQLTRRAQPYRQKLMPEVNQIKIARNIFVSALNFLCLQGLFLEKWPEKGALRARINMREYRNIEWSLKCT
jgi:hypothetical protein